MQNAQLLKKPGIWIADITYSAFPARASGRELVFLKEIGLNRVSAEIRA